MTEQQQPIIPPPELRYEWQSESRFKVISVEREDYMIDRAAQWGADQELEACIHWLITGPYGASITCYPDHMIGDLRAARRPKPLSLKEQALAKTTAILNDPSRALLVEVRETLELNLRALEALPND